MDTEPGSLCSDRGPFLDQVHGETGFALALLPVIPLDFILLNHKEVLPFTLIDLCDSMTQVRV